MSLAAGFLILGASLGSWVAGIASPLFGWAAICLAARRYHDQQRSGRRVLLVLIPVLGALWVACELALRSGQDGENEFGADPRESGSPAKHPVLRRGLRFVA